MAPGRSDVSRKLRCLICEGMKRKTNGCTLSHIQNHLSYKKYSCLDCAYQCGTESASMVHSWDKSHRVEQCESEYLEMLSSYIFRDCLHAADHGMESVLNAMREQHQHTSRTVVNERRNEEDVVEVNTGQGGSKERNKDIPDKDTEVQTVPDSSTLLPEATPTVEHELNSSHVSQTDVNMKSDKTSKVSCRKCAKNVANDYVHRRSHVGKHHVNAGSDHDSIEVLTSQMRVCFPGSIVFNDLQCNECGMTYKSESGRKTHTIRYHMDHMVKCVIHGCTVQERSPAELKTHIQNDHRMVVSREVNTNVFRKFLCAKKEFDAELAPVVLRCFPINLPANSSSVVPSTALPVAGVADAISKVVGSVSSSTTSATIPRTPITQPQITQITLTSSSSSSSDDSGSERYEQALRSRVLQEAAAQQTQNKQEHRTRDSNNKTTATTVVSQGVVPSPVSSPVTPPLTKRKTLLPTTAIATLDHRGPCTRTRSPPRTCTRSSSRSPTRTCPRSPPRYFNSSGPRTRSPPRTHYCSSSGPRSSSRPRSPPHYSSSSGPRSSSRPRSPPHYSSSSGPGPRYCSSFRPHPPPRHNVRPRSNSPTSSHMYNTPRYAPPHMSSRAGYSGYASGSKWSGPRPVDSRMHDEGRFPQRRAAPYQSAQGTGRSFPHSSRKAEPIGMRSMSLTHVKVPVKHMRQFGSEQTPISEPREERVPANTPKKIVSKKVGKHKKNMIQKPKNAPVKKVGKKVGKPEKNVIQKPKNAPVKKVGKKVGKPEKNVTKRAIKAKQIAKKREKERTEDNLQAPGNVTVTVKQEVPSPGTTKRSWVGKRKRLDSDGDTGNGGRPIKQEPA